MHEECFEAGEAAMESRDLKLQERPGVSEDGQTAAIML